MSHGTHRRTGTVVRCGAKGKPDPTREPEKVRARSPAKYSAGYFMLTAGGA